MAAYVFPGQAAQFSGMGKDIYDRDVQARDLFHRADELLDFSISEVMFNGTEEELQQTRVTQPAVFLHSVISYFTREDDQEPEAVAGHSLGEFSALVANQALSFESGLELVSQRAEAMQKACDLKPGTMAAIVGLDDEVVEDVCSKVDGVVVAANYNCPGQLVISGEMKAVEEACSILMEKGARRAMVLKVDGAFHSPLMLPAQEDLRSAIEDTTFQKPICPIYQNVSGMSTIDPAGIQSNLIMQLTSPVRWSASVKSMSQDGITAFHECGGSGKVLSGMIRRIDKDLEISSV